MRQPYGADVAVFENRVSALSCFPSTVCRSHGRTRLKARLALRPDEPLISEDLFDKVQDVLKGRVRKREHKHKTELFPLRGFVVCPKCKSKLTAGNVRGRNGKKIGYYFCWHKGCRAVSVRKEILERDWIILLNMMQPNNTYWKRLSASVSKCLISERNSLESR
jgi:Recombinase zinc beta ribbon domain